MAGWYRRAPVAGSGAGLRRVFPGVAEQALQFFLCALFVGTVLERPFVSEVGIAGFGVQRVQLVHVVLGPVEKSMGWPCRSTVNESSPSARVAARR